MTAATATASVAEKYVQSRLGENWKVVVAITHHLRKGVELPELADAQKVIDHINDHLTVSAAEASKQTARHIADDWTEAWQQVRAAEKKSGVTERKMKEDLLAAQQAGAKAAKDGNFDSAAERQEAKSRPVNDILASLLRVDPQQQRIDLFSRVLAAGKDAVPAQAWATVISTAKGK